MGNILFMPRTNLVAIAMLVATIGTANATGLRGVDSSSSSSSSSSHRRLNALCWIEKPAVDAVVGSGIAVTSQAACVGFDAVADAACELVGGGPEDPFADACALALDFALEAACNAALHQGGKMTAAMVNEKLGCGSRRQLQSVPTNLVQQADTVAETPGETYTCGCICESGPLSMCDAVRECSLAEHLAQRVECAASAAAPTDLPSSLPTTLPPLPKGLARLPALAPGLPKTNRRLNALCWIEKPAVDAVVGSGIAVASQAACVGFDAVADAACELVGGGPEDPFADACALALGIALEAACESALDQGGKMTAAMVNEKLGC